MRGETSSVLYKLVICVNTLTVDIILKNILIYIPIYMMLELSIEIKNWNLRFKFEIKIKNSNLDWKFIHWFWKGIPTSKFDMKWW